MGTPAKPSLVLRGSGYVSENQICDSLWLIDLRIMCCLFYDARSFVYQSAVTCNVKQAQWTFDMLGFAPLLSVKKDHYSNSILFIKNESSVNCHWLVSLNAVSKTSGNSEIADFSVFKTTGTSEKNKLRLGEIFWVIQLGIPRRELWHLSRALTFQPDDHWRHDLTNIFLEFPVVLKAP